MTLHDEVKHYESLGIPREEFKKTSYYARMESGKALRLLNKALYIEIVHPLLRWVKKLVDGIKWRNR